MTKVKKMRRAKGININELSSAIKMRESTVRKIEEGRGKATMEQAMKLARFFNLGITDLFALEDLLCSTAYKRVMEEQR